MLRVHCSGSNRYRLFPNHDLSQYQRLQPCITNGRSRSRHHRSTGSTNSTSTTSTSNRFTQTPNRNIQTRKYSINRNHNLSNHIM